MASAQVATPRGPTRPPVSTLLAVALTTLVIGWAILFSNPGGKLIASVYALPGLFLALRRPGQPLAWLLLLTGLGLALGTTVPTATLEELLSAEADVLGQLTAWGASAGWVAFFAGFLGILLTFPSGTLPDGAWRIVSLVLIATIALCGGLILVGPTLSVDLPGHPDGILVRNPFALPLLADVDENNPGGVVLFPMLLVCQVVALVGLLARSRRSTGLERLQYRWLGSAVALVVFGVVVWALVALVAQTDLVLLPALIIGLTFPAIPIAVVVAVLRHRLYDIDRLVSRTVGWAVASAVVVGVFVAVILGLQAAFSGFTQGHTIATAASTLVAFAVFQPVRLRVQAVVDRRFDRPRVAAERSLVEHGERMQHEVDLATLSHGVEETLHAVLRPSSVAVWIRRS